MEYFRDIRNQLISCQIRQGLVLKNNIHDNLDLYKEGDLYILPRRYGGLCLPMQEALSTGIPVFMPDISPNRDKLPPEWLYPARHKGSFKFHAQVEVFEPNAEQLIKKIEQFKDNNYMQEANKKADSIAEEYSWNQMRDKYLEFITKI
jgi:glycosyltransferase involved in cell wall biosynthesis